MLRLIGQLGLENGNRLQEINVHPIEKLEWRDDVPNRAQHQEPTHVSPRPQRAARRHGVTMIQRYPLSRRAECEGGQWTGNLVPRRQQPGKELDTVSSVAPG